MGILRKRNYLGEGDPRIPSSNEKNDLLDLISKWTDTLGNIDSELLDLGGAARRAGIGLDSVKKIRDQHREMGKETSRLLKRVSDAS